MPHKIASHQILGFTKETSEKKQHFYGIEIDED